MRFQDSQKAKECRLEAGSMKVIGVLALQGAITEHVQALASLSIKAMLVSDVTDLKQVDALIIPGGESTTISRLIQSRGLYKPIQLFAKQHPVMGTCAGLILCSKDIVHSEGNVIPLELIDISVERNGFGRQVDSFETLLDIDNIGEQIPAIFIRAPYIKSVGKDVSILAKLEDKIVAAEYKNILVTAFHPELTIDTRVLEYFSHKCGVDSHS